MFSKIIIAADLISPDKIPPVIDTYFVLALIFGIIFLFIFGGITLYKVLVSVNGKENKTESQQTSQNSQSLLSLDDVRVLLQDVKSLNNEISGKYASNTELIELKITINKRIEEIEKKIKELKEMIPDDDI